MNSPKGRYRRWWAGLVGLGAIVAALALDLRADHRLVGSWLYYPLRNGGAARVDFFADGSGKMTFIHAMIGDSTTDFRWWVRDENLYQHYYSDSFWKSILERAEVFWALLTKANSVRSRHQAIRIESPDLIHLDEEHVLRRVTDAEWAGLVREQNEWCKFFGG